MKVDAIILGAGPSGLAAAGQLGRQGWQVAVVHPPGPPKQVWPETLADLRVLSAAFPSFSPEPGSGVSRLDPGTNNWSGDPHTNEGHWAVDRVLFDAFLRMDVQGVGGCRFHPCAIDQVRVRREDNATWTVQAGVQTLTSGILVDATGRYSRLRQARSLFTWRTVLVAGCWSVPTTAATTPAMDLPGSWIETFEEGWAWGMSIPFSPGQWWLALFVDPSLLQGHEQELGNEKGQDARALYVSHANALRLAPAQRGWQPPEHLTIRDVTPTALPRFDALPNGLYAVGDAALARDPIASQGITAGIAHGLRTATGIHTCLCDPGQHSIVRQFLAESHAHALTQHQGNLAQAFHQAAGCGRFWDARKPSAATQPPSLPLPEWTPDTPFVIGPDWHLETGPVLVGDQISLRPRLVSSTPHEALAYLGGQLLAPALSCTGLTIPLSASQWLAHLHSTGDEPWASAAFRVLLQKRILVSAK